MQKHLQQHCCTYGENQNIIAKRSDQLFCCYGGYCYYIMQYWKAFRRVRLILRIFYKHKLVGVVKCSDCVMVKWESDDQANELYRRRKQRIWKKYVGQNLRYLDTPITRLIQSKKLKSKFSPQKYRVRLLLGCDLYSGKYGN